MAFSVTINGNTYTEASFAGNNYADEDTGLPAAMEDIVQQVKNVFRSNSSTALVFSSISVNDVIALTLEVEQMFEAGQPVTIQDSAGNGSTYLFGRIATYNATTGAATVTVDEKVGSDSGSNWTVYFDLGKWEAGQTAVQGYSEEWANKAEDSLVSTAAGGDGVDDYSSKHFANKSAASADAASTSETNAGTSETNAGTSETNAGTSETNAGTSANNASLAQGYSEEWATKPEDTAVSGAAGGGAGEFSALHYAAKAAASAITADANLVWSNKSATFTAGLGDVRSIFECTGTFTIDLAAAATLTNGWACYVYNTDTGDVTIDPNGAETINGASTLTIPKESVYLIQSDGSNINAMPVQIKTGADNFAFDAGDPIETVATGLVAQDVSILAAGTPPLWSTDNVTFIQIGVQGISESVTGGVYLKAWENFGGINPVKGNSFGSFNVSDFCFLNDDLYLCESNTEVNRMEGYTESIHSLDIPGGNLTDINSVCTDGTDLIIVGQSAIGKYTGGDITTVPTETTGFPGYLLSGAFNGVNLCLLAQTGGYTGTSAWRDIAFNGDGTILYAMETGTDTVYQFNLSSAYDTSDMKWNGKYLSVGAQDSGMSGICFNSTYTKMYLSGSTNDTIYQYTLSVAEDLSTASYDSVSQSIVTDCPNPLALQMNPNGLAIFGLSETGDAIVEYSLSVADDLSSTFAHVSTTTTSGILSPGGFCFNNDGTKIFVTERSSPYDINEFDVSPAYDSSTMSVSGSAVLWGAASNVYGVSFNPVGDKMIAVIEGSDSVFSYDFGTVFDVGGTITESSTRQLEQQAIIEFVGTTNVINSGAYFDVGTSSQFNGVEIDPNNGNVIITHGYNTNSLKTIFVYDDITLSTLVQSFSIGDSIFSKTEPTIFGGITYNSSNSKYYMIAYQVAGDTSTIKYLRLLDASFGAVTFGT